MIEGNKGLHDGVDLEGTDSSAALAGLLRAPVMLVIDAGGITRGVAPLLLGLRDFNPGLRFAGVVLNKVAGARHEAKLRAAIERYTDIPVLGALPRSDALVITERHLGLVPANEAREAGKRIAGAGRRGGGRYRPRPAAAGGSRSTSPARPPARCRQLRLPRAAALVWPVMLPSGSTMPTISTC